MAGVQKVNRAGKEGRREKPDLILRVSVHYWGIYSSRSKIQFTLRRGLRQCGRMEVGSSPWGIFPPGAVVPAPDPPRPAAP